MTVCEGRQQSISCPTSTTIRIEIANYGRTDTGTCPHPAVGNTNCRATNTLNIVRSLCQNRQSCTLNANNRAFGDPCVGTYKYLKVHYRCL